MRKLLIFVVALALLGAACQQETSGPDEAGPALEEGDKAPVFTLKSPDAEISLADYEGEKPVLLYFSMGPG